MKVAPWVVSISCGLGVTLALFAQKDSGITAGSPGKITTVPSTPADANSQESPAEPEFKIGVQQVVAPVSVLNKNGDLVDGIEPSRFRLYDNGVAQNIAVDVSVQPISVVIAIQQSDRVEAVLTQIRKIGPMIQPLVTGDNGEAAVISFDSRIQEKTSFTNDPDKLVKAINSIHAGNTPSRMIDAVERGVSMLHNRPANRRRIILLISETRDVSSEARLRETLINAQLNNVTVYTIDISRLVTSLTSKPQPPAPDPFPPAARNLPGPSPSTPTTVAQAYQIGNSVEFIPLLKEIYLGVKRVFVENPAEVLSESTGGTQFGFHKQHGLEDAIESLSHEIHNQYLLTYTPTNLKEGGFHEIRVDIDMPNLTVRTRPGYFIGGGK